MPATTTFDPVADFDAKVEAVLAKREPRGHRNAIRNVDRMIASLRFAPPGIHVTHLINGKARLEQAVAAMEVA